MPTFADVVAAVQSGDAELGMLPLANNEAGETGARELIAKARLHIVSEPVLPVRMHLLGLPGATLDQIRTVVSHPIALRQCRGALGEARRSDEETSEHRRSPRRRFESEPGGPRVRGGGGDLRADDPRARRPRPRDNATTFAIVSAG